jgi:phosphoribosylanthranilate isomerase
LTRIKMCGIMEPEDLDLALKAGADAVGFVVEVEQSRHCLSRQEACSLISRVPVFAKSVVVVSPENVDDAAMLARDTGADVLQVHGGLAPDEILALKNRINQKVVAASSPDAALARRLSRVADAVLLDTFKDGQLGGSGAVHDWKLSAALADELAVPVILAGGLNPSNVREAVQKVRPYAVDVSSGIETGERKDAAKMAAFVREVRSCL